MESPRGVVASASPKVSTIVSLVTAVLLNRGAVAHSSPKTHCPGDTTAASGCPPSQHVSGATARTVAADVQHAKAISGSQRIRFGSLRKSDDFSIHRVMVPAEGGVDKKKRTGGTLCGMAQVMTVLGPVDPGELEGVGLLGERVLCDLRGPGDHGENSTSITLETLGDLRLDPRSNPNNLLLSSVDDAADELSRFRAHGGKLIVDATSVSEGRNVPGLVKASLVSGVHIVMTATSAEETSADAVATDLNFQLNVSFLLQMSLQ